MIRKWIFYSLLTLIVFLISTGFKHNETKYYDWFHTTEEEELYYNVLTEEESNQKYTELPFTGRTFAGFKQALAFKESQGKYRLINPFGYMGKYQFGMGTLRTIGIRDSIAFLNTPKMQEEAFKALLAIHKHELRHEIETYEGKVVNGVLITESGILAAAHLGGAGSVKKFFRSNGKSGFRDGFGTSLKSYMKAFGGYDTSLIVPNKNAKVKLK
ncbi:MAG: peptidoglycan-binding protein LysM [Flavobacterium sp.]